MSTKTHVQTAAQRPQVVELPRLSLVVLNGKKRGQEFIMDKDMLRVGKSRENDVVLRDQTVSRNHCEIVREMRGYLLRDLESTNGTLLDGAEIREVYLRPGSILTVGKVELKVRTFSERVEILPSERESFGGLVGRSLVMRQIFGLLERVSNSDATLLLGGETGTGKGLLARAVHAASRRKDKAFIVVDCGAVVGSLIESELFGHERGAFSGATQSREGAFELADGGTLFLDEIGELSLELQPKLLRVLEQRSIRRVGGNREKRVDIRVIAATKRELKKEVARGKFREDLYFRLAVVTVDLPPLRERLEDIPLLVPKLLEELSGAKRSSPLRVKASALAALEGHDWPGNVRELRNVLARAAYLTRSEGDEEIRIGHLPLGAVRQPTSTIVPVFDPSLSYRQTKAQFEEVFEKKYVGWLLHAHDGNISAAARAAEMDRKYLHKLAKKHGVHPSAKKRERE